MIIEFQSLQQYSNHDRLKNPPPPPPPPPSAIASVDFKSKAYKFQQKQQQEQQQHHQHITTTATRTHTRYTNSIQLNSESIKSIHQNYSNTHSNYKNNININNDNQIKMQRLDDKLFENINTHQDQLLSESTLTTIKFRKKLYTQESDIT